MSLTYNDIKFYNSGSGSNIGLGGEISQIELQERLFKDVNETQVENGLIDYRCLYIKNISNIRAGSAGETFYRFSLNASDKGYSDIMIGFPGGKRSSGFPDFKSEEQILNFSYSSGISGTFDLFYDSKAYEINWDYQHITNPNHNLYLPCQIKKLLVDIGLVDTNCADICNLTRKINSISRTGNIVTVNTGDAHGYSSSDKIVINIDNVNTNSTYSIFNTTDSSPAIITVLSSTQFTYTTSTSGEIQLGAKGTFRLASNCQTDLEVTIESINECAPEAQCACFSDPLWNDGGKLKCTLQLKLKYPKGRYYNFLVIPTPDPVDIAGSNNIFNSGKIELKSIRLVKGGPINATAETISSSTNTPKHQGSDIVFFNNSETINFETFKPGEYIPVWVKRIVSPTTQKIADDGFTFNIVGYSTPNTTVPPTTLPNVTILDQKQEIWNLKETVEQGKVYWQYFRAGYSGILTNVELGFSKTDFGSLNGKADLRIYKGDSNGQTPPSENNIIYSSGRSGINVVITTNELNWNSYDLGNSQNLQLEKGKRYIIAYTPRFNHQILLNNNNCYSCGTHGVDSTIKPQLDMIFRTWIYTNMDADSDVNSCNSCA
jgi:hypothetical protein